MTNPTEIAEREPTSDRTEFNTEGGSRSGWDAQPPDMTDDDRSIGAGRRGSLSVRSPRVVRSTERSRSIVRDHSTSAETIHSRYELRTNRASSPRHTTERLANTTMAGSERDTVSPATADASYGASGSNGPTNPRNEFVFARSPTPGATPGGGLEMTASPTETSGSSAVWTDGRASSNVPRLTGGAQSSESMVHDRPSMVPLHGGMVPPNQRSEPATGTGARMAAPGQPIGSTDHAGQARTSRTDRRSSIQTEPARDGRATNGDRSSRQPSQQGAVAEDRLDEIVDVDRLADRLSRVFERRARIERERRGR